MEYFINIIIFIIGALIGSFCTLATYRIPRGKDITHERSFCPNCGHKLGFWDLIPLLSYVFLGGKCRYCKEKISPRYFLIELFSGVTILLFSHCLTFNIYKLNVFYIIYMVIGILYITALILIAGIDKEFNKVHKAVFLFLIIDIIWYIIYLCIVDISNIYRYAIYISIIIFMGILNIVFEMLNKKESYPMQIFLLCNVLAIFSGTAVFIETAIATLLAIALYICFSKLKKKELKQIPIAFLICLFNIIFLVLQSL